MISLTTASAEVKDFYKKKTDRKARPIVNYFQTILALFCPLLLPHIILKRLLVELEFNFLNECTLRDLHNKEPNC